MSTTTRLQFLGSPGLLSVALAAGMAYCRPSPPVTAAPPAQAAPAHDLSPAPYEGPAVSIELHPAEGGSEANVKVVFRTGGWELRSDGTNVSNGVGIMRFTFIGPGPQDMVTQSLEEKTWPWRSKEPFSRAEARVNIVRRGEPTREPEYRLAARFPSPQPSARPDGTAYRCLDETYRIAFGDDRAHVTMSDGSRVTLDRLKTGDGPEASRTYSNGRLMFVHEPEGANGPRVLFARGRMALRPCTGVD